MTHINRSSRLSCGISDYEIPEDWSADILANLANVRAGGSAPQGEKYFNGQLPFVRVQHLVEGDDRVRRWDLITQQAVQDYRLRPFPKGTIVFPKSGASIRLEKRAVLPVDAYLVSHLAAVNPNPDKIDHDFLFYYLRFVRLAKGKADGYPTLNLTEIQQLPIPLPPLSEQRSIAYIIGRVQRTKETTERVIAAAKELKNSLMKHLFAYGPVPFEQADQVELKESEVGEVPIHWQISNLGSISRRFQYGTSKRCHADPIGIPVLRIPNVISDKIDLDDLKYLQAESNEINRLLLRFGDLLFVRTNGRKEYVGRCAMFMDEPSNSIFASYLIRCCLNQEMASPEFVQMYCSTPTGRSFLGGRASNASDGKFNINTRTLSQVSLPLPPIEDQIKISRIIRTIEAKIDANQKRYIVLDMLFRSLLHDLMTAKIRVNDLTLAEK